MGFTLIELFVVIAVMAILGGLLFPALSRAKGKASSAGCKSNLRQMGLAVRLYLDDFNAYPVDGVGTSLEWFDAIDAYLTKSRSFIGSSSFLDGTWSCPGDKISEKKRMASGSYGYNEYGAGQGGFGLGTGINYMNTIDGKLFPANRPIKEAEVAVPSDLIVLGDGFTSSSLNNIRHSNFLERNSNSAGLSNEMNLAQARHQGSLNVVFGDGHVEANKIHKLFFDMSDEALRRWNLDHEPHRERLR